VYSPNHARSDQDVQAIQYADGKVYLLGLQWPNAIELIPDDLDEWQPQRRLMKRDEELSPGPLFELTLLLFGAQTTQLALGLMLRK
jgi:hypothetical protein